MYYEKKTRNSNHTQGRDITAECSDFAIVIRMEFLRNKEPRQLLLRFLRTGFGFESGVFWISKKQNFVSCTVLEIVNLKSVLMTQNQNLVRLGITYSSFQSLYLFTLNTLKTIK